MVPWRGEDNVQGYCIWAILPCTPLYWIVHYPPYALFQKSRYFSSILMVVLTIHQVTYTLVKLSLIALFKKMDIDYLCAMITAPYQSYRNPVERIMAIVNLGLQAIAIARGKMPKEMEDEPEKCNSLFVLWHHEIASFNFLRSLSWCHCSSKNAANR